MKQLISSLLFITLGATAQAQHYTPRDENSKVGFTIVNHLIVKSTVNGTFSGLKGNITFSPESPSTDAFDVTVNTGTIKTGIGKRDADLKKEAFFNADKYPTIHIVSTRVEKGKAAGTYVMHGNLTMKGTTKPVVIGFTATPASNGYTFKGSFNLNRLDYGVGEKGKIEEQVVINLDVHATKG